MEWTVKIVGALASVMVMLMLLLVLVQVFSPKPEPDSRSMLPSGFLTQVIALELAESSEEVTNIVGQPSSGARSEMRKEVTFDFVFIAAYWLLFMALSALLAQRGLVFVWLAVVAAICATAAAQMDFLENLRLYTLLDPTASTVPEIEQRAEDVREAARFKFGLIFAATALLAPVFLWPDDWRLRGIGFLYLAAAAVGLLGLWLYRPAVEWGFFLMVLGVIWIAAVFTLIPRKVLGGF